MIQRKKDFFPDARESLAGTKGLDLSRLKYVTLSKLAAQLRMGGQGRYVRRHESVHTSPQDQLLHERSGWARAYISMGDDMLSKYLRRADKTKHRKKPVELRRRPGEESTRSSPRLARGYTHIQTYVWCGDRRKGWGYGKNARESVGGVGSCSFHHAVRMSA